MAERITHAKDAKKVDDLLKELRVTKSEGEMRDIFRKFFDDNWRGKDFIGEVASTSEIMAKESKGGRISIDKPQYYAVAEMARTLSEMNDELRSNILEGRKKPGMEKMTADGFEKAEIKKSVKDFFEQDILNKSPSKVEQELNINPIKVNEARLEIRYGGFNPKDTAAVVKMLADTYYMTNESKSADLKELIRSINANLATEYRDLRGKFESQATFRSVNLA
jgi:hypothetical protein